MKSKRRITVKLKKNSTPEVPAKEKIIICAGAVTACNEFLRECRAAKQLMPVLKEHYRKCFKEKIPQGIAPELIRLKIAYYYQVVEGYQKNNIPVPKSVQQNYEAAQDFNIDGFGDAMRGVLRSEQKEEVVDLTKEEQMVTKKVVVKVAVKKDVAKAAPAVKAKKADRVSGISVASIFGDVFKANFSKKLTDEQIVKVVNAEIKKNKLGRGHVFVAAEVQGIRHKYNTGMMQGGVQKPNKELPKFEK